MHPQPIGHWSVTHIMYSFDTGRTEPVREVKTLFSGILRHGGPVWEQLNFVREDGMRATVDIGQKGLAKFRVTKLSDAEVQGKLNNTVWEVSGQERRNVGEYRVSLKAEKARAKIYFKTKPRPQRFLKTEGIVSAQETGMWEYEGLREYKYDYERKEYLKQQVFACRINQEITVRAYILLLGKAQRKTEGRRADVCLYELARYDNGQYKYSLYGTMPGVGTEDLLENLKKSIERHLRDLKEIA